MGCLFWILIGVVLGVGLSVLVITHCLPTVGLAPRGLPWSMSRLLRRVATEETRIDVRLEAG